MITNLPMPLQLIRLLLLTLCYALGAPSAYASQQWTLEEDDKDVKLYSRSLDSGLVEVKVITQIKVDYLRLMRLLDDTDAAPQWVANCRKVEGLGWFGDKERTVHTFFASPWPFADRDMITTSVASVDEENKTVSINISNYGDRRQVLSHYVRVKDVSGTWTSRQIDDNLSEITYQGYADPAGAIPYWIANRLILSSSFDTFVNLRKQILASRYKVKESPQITE